MLPIGVLAVLLACAVLRAWVPAVEGPERDEGSEAEQPESSATDTDDVQEENGDDAQEEQSDKPVTGEAASRARQAAAAETGGKPGDVERDDEQGATYEVEVTQAAASTSRSTSMTSTGS